MTRLISTISSCHGMSLVQTVAKRQLRMHLRKIREREYSKLRLLVPAVASKKKVSKVQVIEEAVRYIEELHTALVDRFREKHGYLAEDKAKETVQIFVNRMMEEQPRQEAQQHHHQQQYNGGNTPDHNTANSDAITQQPSDAPHPRLPTVSPPSVRNYNDNHHQQFNDENEISINHPHHHHQQHHHHHPYRRHHHHQQIVLHAVQHPVPPSRYPTTSIFQENGQATCALPRPTASRLHVVRSGRRAN